MKRAYLRLHGKGALELIEESFHLLRSAPASVIAWYFTGAVPFIAAFLIFWTDMCHHPRAREHLMLESLVVTLLFFWMKFFQARFARALLAHLSGRPAPGWNAAEVARSGVAQTVAHATALFALPVAAVIALPFAWVYAFYQNLMALDDGKTDLKPLVRRAAQQSALWPAQNHAVLFLLFIFGFCILLNWVAVGLFAPQLLKMLFGIESALTQSPEAMLNTTFFAVMCALTYLSVDPLIKSCYVLRCFYGLSLQSGEDLKADLKSFAASRLTLAAVLVLFLALTPLYGQEAPANPPPAVSSQQLDQSIGEVIQGTKYAWRMPREKVSEKEDGVIASFFKSIGQTIKGWFKAIGEWMEKIMRWLRLRESGPTPSEGKSWMLPPRDLLYLLLAAAGLFLAILLWRTLLKRRKVAATHSVALTVAPDLESENTQADELPEDEWTRLGRQFLQLGDHRLALRAFHLASLAHLASRGLVTISRCKSNREYERELNRRSHALPGLSTLFDENIRVLERIWYGLHEANREMADHFLGNVEKMKGVS